jgi:hypothetical protein
MPTNDRCVDHLHRNVMSCGERGHELGPYASFSFISSDLTRSGHQARRDCDLCLLLIVVVRFGLNTFPKLLRVGSELLLQIAEERSEPVRDRHACAFLWVDGFHGAARYIQ